MSNAQKLVLLSLVVVAVLAGILLFRPGDAPEVEGLDVLCAAGIRGPVAEVAAAYEADYGVRIRLEYGGSGTLLSTLQTRNGGDIYIAADSSYTDIAREKGLVAEVLPLARIRPVIAVPEGNPKGIQGLAGLLQEDVRVAIANPDAASVGKTTKRMVSEAGLWEELEAAVTDRGVFKPTVNDLATDVKLGTVDAAIVWDATARQYPELAVVDLPEAAGAVKEVMAGICNSTADATQALHFARYLASPEHGAPAFERHHFEAEPGDAWADRPEIVYYAGGVNRVAIEETLAAFAEREGVEITSVYNGCGILLGQIKTGGKPDVYHTCDISFMKGVEQQFTAPDPISETKIVILVRPGNPHGIKGLDGLTQEGLQVGLCNEDQSTLGALTAEMLRQTGLYEAVNKNVVVNTPTADFLVSQLTVGKLDAAVVYEANTKFVGDKGELVYLTLPRAMAQQTYAIAREAKYPQLLERLHAAIRSAESRERFVSSGFDFLPEGGAT